jgi:hypothetical protein
MGFIGKPGELTEIEFVDPDELDAPAPAEVPAPAVPQPVPA